MKDEARSLMEVLAHLRRNGVAVRSVEDDAFLTNPMLWGVADQIAHKYSADLSAHTRRGKQTAFQNGRWPGGPTPDGYRYDPVEKTLIVDETRAPIIRRIAQLTLEGLGRNAVARAINAEGHRTSRGKTFTGERVQDADFDGVRCAHRACDRPQRQRATDQTGSEPDGPRRILHMHLSRGSGGTFRRIRRERRESIGRVVRASRRGLADASNERERGGLGGAQTRRIARSAILYSVKICRGVRCRRSGPPGLSK